MNEIKQQSKEWEVEVLRTNLIPMGFIEGKTPKGKVMFCNKDYHAKNCDEPIELSIKVYKGSIDFVGVRKNGDRYKNYFARPVFAKDGQATCNSFDELIHDIDLSIALYLFKKYLTEKKFINLIKNSGYFTCFDDDEYYGENIYIDEQVTSANIRIELSYYEATIRWYYKPNASKCTIMRYSDFLDERTMDYILKMAIDHLKGVINKYDQTPF